jgi:hypothetical protein
VRGRPHARVAAVSVAALLTAAGCGGHSRAPVAAPDASGPSSAGVPARWVPAQTRTSNLEVTKPGAVVHDILLRNADLLVEAPNVTIRRVELQGGRIDNRPGGSSCANGLVIEDTTVAPPPGQRDSVDSQGAIATGGYTARRVKIWRRSEGFRVGGRSSGGCGPVRIEDSFVKIVIPKRAHCQLHSDGIQSYDGPALTVRNTVIDFRAASCGTAPLFVPAGQGNGDVTVDGLLLIGGGFPFRVEVPGRVSGLKIADGTWGYSPLNADCGRLRHWEAKIVDVTADYRVARTVRDLPCS